MPVQVWVHGSAAELEKRNAPNAIGKQTVQEAFGEDKWDGDIVDLRDWGAIACLRIGWAARFVAFDYGTADNGKSGEFWCHYPIPSRVQIREKGLPQAQAVMLNYETTDAQALAPVSVHVWDGNRRIFADDHADRSEDDFNGGIPAETTDPGAIPDLSRVWRQRIGSPVHFGLVVSLQIKAQNSRNQRLEIRGVGIEFGDA